jgi:hypothetical protein
MAILNTLYSIEDIERTLRKHENRLLKYQNVIYLAIGEKVRFGKGKSRLAIRIFVSKKLKRGLPGAVPKRLRAIKPDGSLANYFIPTDVEEAPSTLETLGLKGGDAIIGSTLGSVGLIFQGHNGQNYILTNAHVAIGINQSANNQPVFDLHKQQIGYIFRATPLLSTPGHIHSVDAAVVIPSVETEPFVIDSNPSRVVGYGNKNDFVTLFNQKFFYQRGNGSRLVFQRPNLIATHRKVRVEGLNYALTFTNFFELTLIQGSSSPQPGDSGSVILSDTGNGLIVHGLLFSGARNIIGVIDIFTVFSALATVS